MTDNPPMQIYANKVKNKTVFKIKRSYKLELSFPKTMRLLGSAKKDKDQDKDGEDVPRLESAEVVLVHYNLVNNNYQQASKVIFTFVPNKQFGQLITNAPHSLIVLNATNIEFSSIEVWFTEQKSKQLEVEDNVNRPLILGQIL